MKELLAADHDERAGKVVVGGCRESATGRCASRGAVLSIGPSPGPPSRILRLR